MPGGALRLVPRLTTATQALLVTLIPSVFRILDNRVLVSIAAYGE